MLVGKFSTKIPTSTSSYSYLTHGSRFLHFPNVILPLTERMCLFGKVNVEITQIKSVLEELLVKKEQKRT